MQTPTHITLIEHSDDTETRQGRPLRLVLARLLLALLVPAVLLAGQLDDVAARRAPVCSQTNLTLIRSEISPPLPNLGKFCGVSAVHPTIAAETADPQPTWFSLPGLAKLWAVVIDLLPRLAEVTAPLAAR